MSSYPFSMIYLLIFIIPFICRSLSSHPLVTEKSDESFIKNSEEFIPSNEWQIVKEGQAIPPGLHVRMNLQTGLREAKLLDDSPPNEIISISKNENPQEEISRKNLEQAFANLDLSKDDVVTDKKHEEEIKKKFRSYEELKKDFENLNMKIETDQEIITNLIQQLIKTDNNENRKTILTDLEYYLHQYDNAILFSDMKGLELLLQLLNSTNINNDIRQLTCLALGAAFQGNPKVQLKGLNLNFVQYLLRLIINENDNNIKFRLLFTLSTLLRNFPQAQMNFIQHGGIEIMIKLIDENYSNNKIQMRSIQLMNDLIIEKDQTIQDKRQIYDKIDIRDELVKHGWCSRISQYLISIDVNDSDQIEKTLNAMLPLINVCRMDFISSIPIFDKLNQIYTKTNLNDDSTYNDILTNLEYIRGNLTQTLSSSDL